MAGDETELTTAGAEGARAAVDVSGAFAAAALHSGDGWEAATDAVIADLDLSQAPELGLVFVDSRFAADYGRVLARLRSATGVRHLVGASGQGVIGPGIEAEERPAVSMLALSLLKLEVTTLAIGPDDEARAAIERVAGTPVRAWLLFADPFSADAEALVRAIEKRQPDTPVLGGLASAHNLQSGTAVFLDGAVIETGAVLVGIRGDFRVHTVVAQGAEPVGQPWTVTDCEGNVVRSIGSRPALEVLQETLAELDEETRQRAQQNLLVGLAMDEYRHQHVRGDFLIRNVLGGDRETGAIAINAIPQPRPDVPVPVPRRARSRPRSQRAAGRLPLAPAARRDRARGAALRLQRPRAGPLRHAAPRRPRPRRGARPGADGGALLQRRDRPGGRRGLPPRLHRQHRPAHDAQRLTGRA